MTPNEQGQFARHRLSFLISQALSAISRIGHPLRDPSTWEAMAFSEAPLDRVLPKGYTMNEEG